MPVLVFEIPGDPVPWSAPFVGRKGAFNKPRKAAWLERAVIAIRASPDFPSEPITEPVRFILQAILARPKRLQRKKDPDGLIHAPVRPDRVNLGKLAEDALEIAGVLRDDSLVVDGRDLKYYAEKGGRPRSVITVVPMEEAECLSP